MEKSSKCIVAIIIALGIAIACMVIASVSIKKAEKNILDNVLSISADNFELNKKYGEKYGD